MLLLYLPIKDVGVDHQGNSCILYEEASYSLVVHYFDAFLLKFDDKLPMMFLGGFISFMQWFDKESLKCDLVSMQKGLLSPFAPNLVFVHQNMTPCEWPLHHN